MRILVTGASGFIGRNLISHLSCRPGVEILRFTRQDDPGELPRLLADADFVFHLAGVNRPPDPGEFEFGNSGLTKAIASELSRIHAETGRAIPLLFTSSIHAERDNPYGRSKLGAEEHLRSLAKLTGGTVYLCRLVNVFGKWCRPNYNSAVATFCHNIARDLAIQINDPAAPLRLVHVDDVVRTMLAALDGMLLATDADGFVRVGPEYQVTVGGVAELLRTFRVGRTTLSTERVGTGFVRTLYSTYLSYVPPKAFSYLVPQYTDPRGVFVEMLKTPDCGQFSYFTAQPGITRGGHYHHTKTEKFLVIKGHARFRFCHIDTGEKYELVTTGEKAEIVETVPGWAHDITNIGPEEMVVMLWANEVFDRQHPDTYNSPL